MGTVMRWFVVVLALLTGAHAATPINLFANGGAGLTHGAFVQLAIGGGGFVTNQVIASDGTELARTDTAGAFWRSSHTAKWLPVITQASMPAADVAPGYLFGVCEVAIAPSNTAHFYMYFSPRLSPSAHPA